MMAEWTELPPTETPLAGRKAALIADQGLAVTPSPDAPLFMFNGHCYRVDRIEDETGAVAEIADLTEPVLYTDGGKIILRGIRCKP